MDENPRYGQRDENCQHPQNKCSLDFPNEGETSQRPKRKNNKDDDFNPNINNANKLDI